RRSGFGFMIPSLPSCRTWEAMNPIAALSISAAAAVLCLAAARPEIASFETGYPATSAGAVVVTKDGRVLWATSVPEGLAKGAFPIMRGELPESRDSGRTWGPPHVLMRGNKETVPSIAELLQLASGRILLVGTRFGNYSMDGDPEKSLNDTFMKV